MVCNSKAADRPSARECDLIMIAFIKRHLRVEDHGGAKGWLEHLQARTADALGLYRDQQRIDWPHIQRLVFVCKGNICRSPYGEARARSLGWRTLSMGLDARSGSVADPDAVAAAARRSIDLQPHRSLRFDPAHLAEGDLLLGFEAWHVAGIRKQVSGPSVAVALVGLWSTPRRPHITDPHGRSARYFDLCFDNIDTSLQALTALRAR